jgi:hypothetical protein
MDLREKNERFLSDHVRKRYPRDDLFEDLYNEAWVFVGEAIDGQDLADPAYPVESLDRHLEEYARDVYGFSGRSATVPLDEVIAYVSEGRQSPEPGAEDESWEAEAASYEYEMEGLRRLLTPLEFEALETLTHAGRERRQVLTLGLTEQGIQMLLRRALIRKLWSEKD